ncbi:hypothetical protein ACKFKF_19400 [Phormidesmis sp. 146-12]
MPITHRTYTRPARVPRADELVIGQLSINAADGKLFIKLTDGRVICVGQNTAQLASTPDGLSAILDELTISLGEKAPTVHVHQLSDVTGLQSVLDSLSLSITEALTMFNNFSATPITQSQPISVQVDVTPSLIVEESAPGVRKGLTIWNGQTAPILIDFDRDPESSNFAGKIEPGGSFTLEGGQNGAPSFSIRAVSVAPSSGGRVMIRVLS